MSKRHTRDGEVFGALIEATGAKWESKWGVSESSLQAAIKKDWEQR